jgi:hypothetical protein
MKHKEKVEIVRDIQQFRTMDICQKPIWHTENWSVEQLEDLITELRLAKRTRSLTNEEQFWLKAAEELEENL